MNILEKAGVILVKCGYGKEYVCELQYKDVMGGYIQIYDECWDSPDNYRSVRVDPFADTLEGRRQTDAIEDWLVDNRYGQWFNSKQKENVKTPVIPRRHWRLDRIKWCLEELT